MHGSIDVSMEVKTCKHASKSSLQDDMHVRTTANLFYHNTYMVTCWILVWSNYNLHMHTNMQTSDPYECLLQSLLQLVLENPRYTDEFRTESFGMRNRDSTVWPTGMCMVSGCACIVRLDLKHPRDLVRNPCMILPEWWSPWIHLLCEHLAESENI